MSKQEVETMVDFAIYSTGLCYASVCSSLPQDEVEKRMRLESTSISSPWALADKPFKTGESNPHPCELNPKTHKHYLFSC